MNSPAAAAAASDASCCYTAFCNICRCYWYCIAFWNFTMSFTAALQPLLMLNLLLLSFSLLLLAAPFAAVVLGKLLPLLQLLLQLLLLLLLLVTVFRFLFNLLHLQLMLLLLSFLSLLHEIGLDDRTEVPGSKSRKCLKSEVD
jgi:hypothetical protein